MTETSCLIAGTQEGDNTSGHVGSPSPACGKHLTPNYQIQVLFPTNKCTQPSVSSIAFGITSCDVQVQNCF